MRNCEDCIHFKACVEMAEEFNTVYAKTCEDFSDRSLWVKLPCLTGTTVYTVYHEISGKRNIAVGTVERFNFYGDDYVYAYVFYETGVSYWHSSGDFGKTVFLSREEAERALKERESNDE